MPQTPDEMRTGRSLEQWLVLVRASGLDPVDQAAVRAWLRREHGVPQNSQWAIADAAAREAGWVRPTVFEYLDRQYASPKAALRPIYDALAAAIGRLGDDVTVEGRGGYTPFVRGRQFAAIAAATRTGSTSACGSPTRHRRRGCNRAAGPGRRRTRYRCAAQKVDAKWSTCRAWPISRTPDRGPGR